MQNQSFSIPGVNGELINGNLWQKSLTSAKQPLIIFCHGFKGFKDWGCIPYICNRLASNGFAVINFNFSHNGHIADSHDCVELDKFKQNTFSLEIEDLIILIKSFINEDFCTLENIDSNSIGLIGHSRGASAAICIADKFQENVKAVVSFAGISSYTRPRPDTEREWREKGVVYIKNTRTGVQLPLGEELLDDMILNRDRIENEVRQLKIPLLACHGDKDNVVDVQSARDLVDWAEKGALSIVNGGDHVFGSKHPFVGISEFLNSGLNEVEKFFKLHLI